MKSIWKLEEWIWRNLSPIKKDAATILYERMESQSDYKLPVIYQPLDVKKRGHWHDVAICSSFAASMEKAKTILDIGPGDGWPILRIAHHFQRAIGIDLSPKRVEVQKENARRLGIDNVEFMVMDSMDMDFQSESFQGVVAASSIEQSENPKKSLQEIARVLTKGGKLAIYFEDFEVYFPTKKGDERLWADFREGEPILFYGCREKESLREAIYTLFLDERELEENAELKEKLIEIGPEPWHTLEDSLPDSLLLCLKPIIKECYYYELTHLSSYELERDLIELGFEDIFSIDPFMPDVMDFFQLAKERGHLSSLEDTFSIICELMGICKVKEREEGLTNFLIATKGG